MDPGQCSRAQQPLSHLMAFYAFGVHKCALAKWDTKGPIVPTREAAPPRPPGRLGGSVRPTEKSACGRPKIYDVIMEMQYFWCRLYGGVWGAEPLQENRCSPDSCPLSSFPDRLASICLVQLQLARVIAGRQPICLDLPSSIATRLHFQWIADCGTTRLVWS